MGQTSPFFTSLRISNDEINNLQQLMLDQKVTVVNNHSSLMYALTKISSQTILGFDTESRPSFKKGQSYPVSIIQFSTFEEAFIFQLSFIPFGKEIADILSNPNIKKVGIATKDDISKLQKLFYFEPACFIDLASLATKKGLPQTGARALTARYLGKRLSKTAQRTNWALPSLSSRQITYAALDAIICIKILPLLEDDIIDYHKLKEEEETIELNALKRLEENNQEALSTPNLTIKFQNL